MSCWHGLVQAGNLAAKACRNTPPMAHPTPSSPKPNTTFPVSHVLRAGVINYILQNKILPAQQKEKRVPTALFYPFVLKRWAVVQHCAAEQGPLQNTEK